MVRYEEGWLEEGITRPASSRDVGASRRLLRDRGPPPTSRDDHDARAPRRQLPGARRRVASVPGLPRCEDRALLAPCASLASRLRIRIAQPSSPASTVQPRSSWTRRPGSAARPRGRPWRGPTSISPCPVVPTKIVCGGRNYAAHAQELGNDVPVEPLLFLKPPSALIGPGESIVLPPESQRVEHEAELGVVIGRRARDVRPEHALITCLGTPAWATSPRGSATEGRAVHAGQGVRHVLPCGTVDRDGPRSRGAPRAGCRELAGAAGRADGATDLGSARAGRVHQPGDDPGARRRHRDGDAPGRGTDRAGDELVIDIAGATAETRGIGALPGIRDRAGRRRERALCWRAAGDG